jgi:hypothetical protein
MYDVFMIEVMVYRAELITGRTFGFGMGFVGCLDPSFFIAL